MRYCHPDFRHVVNIVCLFVIEEKHVERVVFYTATRFIHYYIAR